MTTVDKKDQPLPGMPPKKRSRSHRLGYDAEHAVEVYLTERGFPCVRPRAGSAQDKGDLGGLPVVVSVKNHARTELSSWVGALPRMCEAARLPFGVVWHKRRGKGDPGEWYVTMTGDTFLAFLSAYREAGSGVLRPNEWCCDSCMRIVTRSQVAIWADGEHVICTHCADRMEDQSW